MSTTKPFENWSFTTVNIMLQSQSITNSTKGTLLIKNVLFVLILL